MSEEIGDLSGPRSGAMVPAGKWCPARHRGTWLCTNGVGWRSPNPRVAVLRVGGRRLRISDVTFARGGSVPRVGGRRARIGDVTFAGGRSVPPVPALAGPGEGHGGSAEIVAVANAVLAGVPTAYVMSHSTLITVIAATAACLSVIAHLGLRRDPGQY